MNAACLKTLLPIAMILLIFGSVILAEEKGKATQHSRLRSVSSEQPFTVQNTAIKPSDDSDSPQSQYSLGFFQVAQLSRQVVAGGGGPGGSVSYTLDCTVAQSTVGAGTSESFFLSHGFWPTVVVVGGDYLCGDANADGQVNVGDVVWIINYVFSGGPETSVMWSGL
jgi:hypothetical protein